MRKHKHSSPPAIRTANSRCRKLVEQRLEFRGHNLFGEWRTKVREDDGSTYTVYSYGHHFPIYVWDREAERWYGNKCKYSPTTSKHQSQAMPFGVEITWVDTDDLIAIAKHGVNGWIRARMELAA